MLFVEKPCVQSTPWRNTKMQSILTSGLSVVTSVLRGSSWKMIWETTLRLFTKKSRWDFFPEFELQTKHFYFVSSINDVTSHSKALYTLHICFCTQYSTQGMLGFLRAYLGLALNSMPQNYQISKYHFIAIACAKISSVYFKP